MNLNKVIKMKKPSKSITFAIDFDGTCVMHEFPETGKDVPLAVETLKMLQDAGHKLILWTMRSNMKNKKSDQFTVHQGDYLKIAEDWFKERGIELYGSQRNPTQDSWTESPKAYAQIISMTQLMVAP